MKAKKMLISILIALLLISLSITTVQAASIGDIFDDAEGFISTGESAGTSGAISESSLQNMSNLIYNILLILGIAIAVIIGVVLGIQFMTGGVEEKAKVKDSLIPYVAGCVVIFGAFTIWKIVITILQGT